MKGRPPAVSLPQKESEGVHIRLFEVCFKTFGWRARMALLPALFLATAAVWAQDGGVTDNDVIRVAERMYCPVCENIPLDDCETIACVEWKAEIRAQLAAGASDQAVIDSFVARFGDNVVGVPQDPVLRALTVIMPLLATALALGAAGFTFRRFGAQPKLRLESEPAPAGDMTDEAYRRRLEEDVRGRR